MTDSTKAIKTRRERFASVAPRRVENFQKAARSLERCSRNASYEYSDAEAERVVQLAQKAVDRISDAFFGNTEPEDTALILDAEVDLDG